MHGIVIGDPAKPMRIRGQAALAYARDSWGRDEAKYIGIDPNPVDEEGIFPATRDQVEDVASEDVGLIYVEFPRDRWEKWLDDMVHLLQLTADDIEWDGVDAHDCNWEEVIPEWMMEFQGALVAMAHQPWLCQVDGGEGGVEEFMAMCPRHAMAQAAAWVVKGDWPLPGSVVVEVKALKGARGEGFNYARHVVVGPDPLPRLVLETRRELVDWLYEHAPPCVSEEFISWAASRIIDQAGWLEFGDDWAYQLDKVDFAEMEYTYAHLTEY